MFEFKDFTLLNKTVIPGETKIIELQIATLHTMTELKIPVIVSRSIHPGPTVLFSAGLHGDELIGVEIVRQLITKKINEPNIGTIICIPLINVFGFVNQSREFPDGRDLNRVFPGSANGSLASRFAYRLIKDILPLVDYVIDFHAGGKARFNAPQIRIEFENEALEKMAKAFDPPFVLYSKNIEGSFRNACDELGIQYILFEGGKSLDINSEVVREGIEGSMRFLSSLNMLNKKFEVPLSDHKTIFIESSSWIRAQYSGLFSSDVRYGDYVIEGQILGKITDPYGAVEEKVIAPNSGYIINENQGPIVFQGDAIYHISTQLINKNE